MNIKKKISGLDIWVGEVDPIVCLHVDQVESIAIFIPHVIPLKVKFQLIFYD